MTIVELETDDSFKRPGTIPFSWEIRPGVPKTRPESTTTNLLLQHHPHKKLSPLRLKPLSNSLLVPPPALSPPSSSFITTTKSRPLSPLTPPSFSTTPSKLKPPPPGFLYSPAPSFRSSPRAFSERWLNRVRPGPGSESEPRHRFDDGFRSSPRGLSERWKIYRPNRVKPGSDGFSEKSLNRVRTGSESDFDVGFGSSPCGLSERWKLYRLNRVKPESRTNFDVVGFGLGGLGCFPTLRKKKSSCGRGMENEYCSDMEMMSPWSVSSRRSVSPRSSFSSLRFTTRSVNEAEWVGFGFF